MQEQLKELIGKKVAVWSGAQGSKDEGVFERCDGTWVRIRAKEQVLYLCVHNIRLIKPLEEIY
jgi:hypothetical protein